MFFPDEVRWAPAEIVVLIPSRSSVGVLTVVQIADRKWVVEEVVPLISELTAPTTALC